MNEIDILALFYEEMKEQGINRQNVFLNFDSTAIERLQTKHGKNNSSKDIYRLVDTCLINEWIERTTVDPGYNYLSLTEAGLQVLLDCKYD